MRRITKLLSLAFAALLIVTLVVEGAPVGPAEPSFTFAFGGDTGEYGVTPSSTGSYANAGASLQALPPGLSFFVDVGDITYNGTSNGFPSTGNEVLWCNFVKNNIDANLGSNLPWIQVVGNHEDGNSAYAKDGYIDAFTAPNCLPKPSAIGFVPSTVGCPDASPFTGCYGREGYWDYPLGKPMARFIMIAGAEKIGNGTTTTTYNYCALRVCSNQGFDRRWAWLKWAIDEAKAEGLWVIVFDHKPCLTPDLATTCEGFGTFNGHNPGAQKWNLFFAEGVDLVINGHAHIHARSKQLTCYGPTEPDSTLLTSVTYSEPCVTDDGSDNTYVRGRGVVNLIEGAFSQEDGQLNFTRADTSYFARAMSARTSPSVVPPYCCWVNGVPVSMNSGVGFGMITISPHELSYKWRMSLMKHFGSDETPTFSDSFVIKGDDFYSAQGVYNALAALFSGRLGIIVAGADYAALILTAAFLGISRRSRGQSSRNRQDPVAASNH